MLKSRLVPIYSLGALKQMASNPSNYRYLLSEAYIFVLMHEYQSNPVYRETIDSLARQGAYLMIDNGAFELGSSIKVPEWLDTLEAIRLSQPAEAVAHSVVYLPDVLYNGDDTHTLSCEAMRQVSKRVNLARYQLFYIPQIDSRPDGVYAKGLRSKDNALSDVQIQCMAVAALANRAQLYLHGIGLPQHFGGKSYLPKRERFARYIDRRGPGVSRIHFLGMHRKEKRLESDLISVRKRTGLQLTFDTAKFNYLAMNAMLDPLGHSAAKATRPDWYFKDVYSPNGFDVRVELLAAESRCRDNEGA